MDLFNNINREFSNAGNSINQFNDNPAARAFATGGRSIPLDMAGLWDKDPKASAAASGGASGIMSPGYNSVLNSEAYKNLKKRAMSKGQSPWAGMAASKQALLASQGMDKAAQMAGSQAAQAQGNLAATGGITSGARERIIGDQARNYLDAASGIGRAKDTALLDIGMEDAKQKLGLLGQVGNLEMKDVDAKNQYEQNLYNQKMQAWAAQQQAQATRDSGKK